MEWLMSRNLRLVFDAKECGTCFSAKGILPYLKFCFLNSENQPSQAKRQVPSYFPCRKHRLVIKLGITVAVMTEIGR